MEQKTTEARYTVYKYTTPSGKVYVGLTSMPMERRKSSGYHHNYHFKAAVKKYGWQNIKEEILAENVSLEEANLLETYYIETYDARDRKHGYNLLTGGMKRTLTPAIKDKIRMSMPQRRAVICVETGEWFSSVSEAAEKTGIPRRSIRHVLAGERLTAHNYHWRYADDNGGAPALHESHGAEEEVRIREVEHSHDDVGG